jgi:hypothetical protein
METPSFQDHDGFRGRASSAEHQFFISALSRDRVMLDNGSG